ncbi:hypothetical protein H9L39_19333 [Fusarium oxysporum f. sp. albedinis]|nr:hypothetical protein H9L39_19333 [Fusarium oxysporum f. sp. albedinis]
MTSSQTTAASTPSISDQPITGTSLDFFLFFNATYPDEDTQNTTGGSHNFSHLSGYRYEGQNFGGYRYTQVCPRSWEHIEKQHMLARFAGLASMAAATALKAEKAVEHALQLLELGRGVIAGLLMEARADISDLRGQHPGLADEFVRLRDELDSPDSKPAYLISTDTTDTPSWKPEAERRRKADQSFDRLVENIRTQPGFSNFLLPPTAAELMAAADPDPIIVVNLSPYRCDSFLIERHGVRAVELPDLTLEEVDRQVRDLRSPCRDTSSLLKWLWDVVCGPSLEALGFTTPPTPGHNWPRVWWIPTGLLSQMPLHAAGYHAHGSADTVIDRVMSSYASSVKALRYDRRHHIRKSAGPLSDLALLVAMRETPGLGINGNLPFATNEVGVLSSFCTSLRLQAITPKLRKDDVLKHLQACQIFHFAGHGRSDPTEPSHSCLLLEDWESTPLTVEDLRNHKLHENPPFLAYLSACSTGANQVDMLADEGIHLVSAFQLAGFRHVIGTLWEVSDEHCVDVAKVVYETMRDEGITDVAVCRGLHRAARALRDGQIEIESAGRDAKLLGFGSQARRTTNLYWVPYVHFGV